MKTLLPIHSYYERAQDLLLILFLDAAVAFFMHWYQGWKDPLGSFPATGRIFLFSGRTLHEAISPAPWIM